MKRFEFETNTFLRLEMAGCISRPFIDFVHLQKMVKLSLMEGLKGVFLSCCMFQTIRIPLKGNLEFRELKIDPLYKDRNENDTILE